MDLGAILLLIALLVGVSLYLAAPLINNRSRSFSEDGREFSTLMAERERILNALLELDFDFKLGKIPEGDYPGQRAELLQKGADVLRKLDSLSASPTPHSPAEYGADSANAAPDGSRKHLNDDEIESMLSARRRERKTKSAGFCPRCGKPVQATDQFCPSCGKALK